MSKETREPPNRKWIREAREDFVSFRAKRGEAPTEEEFRTYLEVLAFIRLEEAQTLLAHAYDPTGESVDESNRATETLVADLNRHMRFGPVYAAAPGCDGVYEWLDAIERRLVELRTMPYRKYLASPEWAVQRRSALRRAGDCCETCGRTHRLQVHHRTYERRGDEAVEDLVVLCDDCHRSVHTTGGSHRPRRSERV